MSHDDERDRMKAAAEKATKGEWEAFIGSGIVVMTGIRSVVDGRIVSGQNQNAGPEVANLMIEAAGGTRR